MLSKLAVDRSCCSVVVRIVHSFNREGHVTLPNSCVDYYLVVTVSSSWRCKLLFHHFADVIRSPRTIIRVAVIFTPSLMTAAARDTECRWTGRIARPAHCPSVDSPSAQKRIVARRNHKSALAWIEERSKPRVNNRCGKPVAQIALPRRRVHFPRRLFCRPNEVIKPACNTTVLRSIDYWACQRNESCKTCCAALSTFTVLCNTPDKAHVCIITPGMASGALCNP
mmetsp:Transcript_33400/g.81231  ORF Transcript_33400/g.81231 Transcript_33400/m.81231 type:complete len:225 (+) Transcript_33400:340-1014(+)